MESQLPLQPTVTNAQVTRMTMVGNAADPLMWVGSLGLGQLCPWLGAEETGV